jgi:hypothetical protein
MLIACLIFCLAVFVFQVLSKFKLKEMNLMQLTSGLGVKTSS